MTALVKICGITTTETMRHVRDLPIDYIGLVFAKSKRQVNAEQAAKLLAELQEAEQPPQSVGVFVDPSMEELAAILAQAPLDVVQLHGQETPEFCRQVKEAFGVQVFKVLPVARQNGAVEDSEDKAAYGDANADADGSLQLQMPDAYVSSIDTLMLDTFDARVAGGTGVPFRWDVIPTYREWAEQHGLPLIIAGGLHADNVATLLADYAPHGVDVSSGVETDGKKDIDKIEAFVERVKGNVRNDA